MFIITKEIDMKSIVKYLDMIEGDIHLEIGAGNMLLSLVLSQLTKNFVIATEILAPS